MNAVIRAAEQLVEPIRARAEEIEAARQLPADLARTLADAGMFRMLVPEDCHGLEVTPQTFAHAVETVATGDAAVGWCVMIGATAGINAAYLPKAVAQQVHSNASVITGGIFAPQGRAMVEGDHFKANGRWPWASGSANCDFMYGGCVVFEGEKPRMRGEVPETRMLLFRREDVELIDTWQSSGLRGTGSGDMAVRDVEVPVEHSVSLFDDPVADGPLYTFPVFGLLAVGIASVALGNARAALTALADLARAKKPQFGRRSLAERAVVQSDFAKAQGRLHAARAYLNQAIDQCWSKANDSGRLSLEDRAELRLACTHATRESADVATTAYELGGGTSVYATHPLQRHFRDAHVATQHIMVAPSTYELIGRVGLGVDTQSAML